MGQDRGCQAAGAAVLARVSATEPHFPRSHRRKNRLLRSPDSQGAPDPWGRQGSPSASRGSSAARMQGSAPSLLARAASRKDRPGSQHIKNGSERSPLRPAHTPQAPKVRQSQGVPLCSPPLHEDTLCPPRLPLLPPGLGFPPVPAPVTLLSPQVRQSRAEPSRAGHAGLAWLSPAPAPLRVTEPQRVRTHEDLISAQPRAPTHEEHQPSPVSCTASSPAWSPLRS